MMTIRVYRASPGTEERQPIGEPVTVPSGDPEQLKDDVLVWAPCACPRHQETAK